MGAKALYRVQGIADKKRRGARVSAD